VSFPGESIWLAAGMLPFASTRRLTMKEFVPFMPLIQVTRKSWPSDRDRDRVRQILWCRNLPDVDELIVIDDQNTAQRGARVDVCDKSLGCRGAGEDAGVKRCRARGTQRKRERRTDLPSAPSMGAPFVSNRCA
jgi:hypothetical protein